MIDGNISMEEDTELRDLVVQTLENNGVLGKLRAKLRASVFLALEEQEAAANPEPLLNKTVRQYLANSDGKLLFSLVREFLEYFGLDYTISVYDSETYLGKEYNYAGRNKLSEKLGIQTTAGPLLGAILKSEANRATDQTQKSDTNDVGTTKTNDGRTHFSNSTFEVSVSKIDNGESEYCSNDNDNDNDSSADKPASNTSDIISDIPINVTITDKKKLENLNVGEIETANNNVKTETSENFVTTTNSTSNQTNLFNKSEHLIKFDESLAVEETRINVNDNDNDNDDTTTKQKIPSNLRITNNVENTRKRIDADNNLEKMLYFDEIIVDGKKDKLVETIRKKKSGDSLLGEVPPIATKTNSIFADLLLPINGQKTNINDLKQLMDIGLGAAGTNNYGDDDDFGSSASGSANESSPVKDTPLDDDGQSSERGSSSKQRKNSKQSGKLCQMGKTDDISEDIDEIEEVFSNASCVSDQLII